MSDKTKMITVREVEGIAEDQTRTMAMQSQLRQAIFDSINEADVAAIVKKQVEKAKAGDDKSLQFVMRYVLGCGQPISVQQNLVVDTETAARLTRGGK